MKNPFTYTFLAGLMVFGPTPLAFAGGLRSPVKCCPTPARVIVTPAQTQRVQVPPSKPTNTPPRKPQSSLYKSGYQDGYRAGLGKQQHVPQVLHVQSDCCESDASAVAKIKLQILNAQETLEDAHEIGQMARAVTIPSSQPAAQPQSSPAFFSGNQTTTAAYPASSTQFATFQEVFQPRYHEIIDRSVRASENASTLNTQVLREAVTGALEISKIEQAIAEAEVEVKKINAQAHLLAASRDRQSISTFGTAPLANVQQGDLRASAGVVGVQPAATPNYGAVGLRDGNQCAVCHSRSGSGVNSAAIGAFDVERLTVESAQRAIQAMASGRMPQGQAAYSAAEQHATKSQLEAALGMMLP